jgi:hypothetical protein
MTLLYPIESGEYAEPLVFALLSLRYQFMASIHGYGEERKSFAQFLQPWKNKLFLNINQTGDDVATGTGLLYDSISKSTQSSPQRTYNLFNIKHSQKGKYTIHFNFLS